MQIEYAEKSFGAENRNRKKIALEVGYSVPVANSIVSKIESRKGYLNAMSVLVSKSNNLAISIFEEFKNRKMSDFTNKELIQSLGTISNAMDRFSQRLVEAENPEGKNGNNRLRTIVLQNIKKQVNTNTPVIEKQNDKPLVEYVVEEDYDEEEVFEEDENDF